MNTTLTAPRAETAAEYHSDLSSISATALKTLDESPSLFSATYIHRTYQRPDTADLKLGRVLHARVLQPDRFAELCPIMPAYEFDAENVTADKKPRKTSSKNTLYYQQRKIQFTVENRGKDIIDSDDLASVKAMSQAIWDHDEASMILEASSENEVIHRWQDRVRRRCMMDAPRPGLGVCADIKTIQGRPTARNFAVSAAKFRWHLQAPFYLGAMNDLYGPDDYRFLFIVVGKAEPHEVAIHELTADDLEWSAGRVEELVSELIQRRETNNWQAEYQRGICCTPLPRYVRSRFYDLETE